MLDESTGKSTPDQAVDESHAASSEAGRYAGLSRDQLIALLERRDRSQGLGLVWERESIDADKAINQDFVALYPIPELHCGDGPHHHAIIEGDNYDALRALRATHSGHVKCIYIDPPYNTGNRDFVYNDRRIDPEHRYRHSLWLEFMHKRLKLARGLLHPDGAIFVSIDDHEVFRLGMLMDMVFGADRHVATCVWQKRYSRENRGAIGDAHEYLLVYAANPERFKAARNRLPLADKQRKLYSNPDKDSRGAWQSVSLLAQGYRPNQMYAIEAPNGTVHYPPDGRCWAVTEPVFAAARADGRVWFGKDGNGVPRRKMYLSEAAGLIPWTWWPHDEVGHTDEARKDIRAILGSQTAFDTPKPVRLMERIVRLASNPGDTVLDFFAGSGSFGHAVLKVDAEQPGPDRRCILVSNAEATDETPERNLCRDVCAERMRRVIAGYTSPSGAVEPGLGGGFAYLRAQRLPTHRVSTKIGHQSAWAMLTMQHHVGIHDYVADQPLQCAAIEDGVLVYVPKLTGAAIEALDLLVSEGKRLVVYCWSPQRLRHWEGDPKLVVRGLPEGIDQERAS